MSTLLKPAFIMGLAAMVTSAPLAMLVDLITQHQRSPLSTQLLHASPILVGIAGAAWFLGICSLAPGVWKNLAPLVGALTGLLCFLSFGVGFACAAVALEGTRYNAVEFAQISGCAFLVMGWLPLLVGGGVAWLARHLQGSDTAFGEPMESGNIRSGGDASHGPRAALRLSLARIDSRRRRHGFW